MWLGDGTVRCLAVDRRSFVGTGRGTGEAVGKAVGVAVGLGVGVAVASVAIVWVEVGVTEGGVSAKTTCPRAP